jgi:hypothetical protein
MLVISCYSLQCGAAASASLQERVLSTTPTQRKSGPGFPLASAKQTSRRNTIKFKKYVKNMMKLGKYSKEII